MSISNEISLENVLRRCGDFGRFQFIHFFFLNLITIVSGITTYYYVFGVAEPSFRCRLPSNIWPHDDQFKPINNTHQLLIETWLSSSSKCDDINGSICSDFVYDQSVFGRTFTEDANFVCRNAVKKTWLATLYQIGASAVLLTGWIGDKVGRQQMIRVLSVTLVVIPLLTQVFLQTINMTVNAKFTLLLINQLVLGIDAYAMAFLLLMEITSSSHTSFAANLGIVGFSLGQVLVTLFAYLARDWLLLKWIITGYLALLLPYLYFLPESPYWLFSKKKYNQLEVCLRKIAIMNGRLNNEWYPYYVQLIRDPHIAIRSTRHAAQTNKEKIVRYLPRLSICGIIGFVTMFLYIKISYGLGTMNDTVSPFWSIIIAAVIEFIGDLIASILITTRLGRKYMLIIFTLSTSICIFVVPFIMQSYPLMTIVISQVGKLMISGAVLVSWIYVPELFPTPMRGLANGVFVFVGRGGAILAPIVDTAVGDKYIKITFYGYTVVGLVMIGLVFLLPETRNRSFNHGEEEDDDEEENEVHHVTQSDNNEDKHRAIMWQTTPVALRINKVDVLQTKF